MYLLVPSSSFATSSRYTQNLSGLSLQLVQFDLLAAFFNLAILLSTCEIRQMLSLQLLFRISSCSLGLLFLMVAYCNMNEFRSCWSHCADNSSMLKESFQSWYCFCLKVDAASAGGGTAVLDILVDAPGRSASDKVPALTDISSVPVLAGRETPDISAMLPIDGPPVRVLMDARLLGLRSPGSGDESST
jgi:hypothetical protein